MVSVTGNERKVSLGRSSNVCKGPEVGMGLLGGRKKASLAQRSEKTGKLGVLVQYIEDREGGRYGSDYLDSSGRGEDGISFTSYLEATAGH